MFLFYGKSTAERRRAAYLMYGTEIAAGHHNSCFDFDEKCLYKAVAVLTELAIAYTNK